MKIAIPLFNERVSPRFEFASRLLLATVENNRVVEREELALHGYDLFERSALLKGLSVDTLICGGIQCFVAQDLNHSNVRVISAIVGEADAALKAFLRGSLSPLVAQQRPNPACPRRRKRLNRKENKDATLLSKPKGDIKK
jgi:predicted Fe-Mo cluster-binding NifX family protein